MTQAAVVAVDDELAGAGVTLVDPDGRRSSAASTNADSAAADALQYELGQGPCLSAWASGQPVAVEDVRADLRWPEWSTAVEPLGVRACVSVPLLTGGLAFGAIKVYWDKSMVITPRLVRLMELFAAQAAIFLVNVQARERVRTLSEQLKSALAQRDVIGTAKGITMSSQGLGEQAAMRHLMTKARDENRTLRDVAEEVIESMAPPAT
ncbi:GAF and ANTAR domain-containing protein [Arthrobacter sp. M4]|nr:GAF and ANTAR domain-containing protein [Arthrobacter sp. M4]